MRFHKKLIVSICLVEKPGVINEQIGFEKYIRPIARKILKIRSAIDIDQKAFLLAAIESLNSTNIGIAALVINPSLRNLYSKSGSSMTTKNKSASLLRP